MKRILVAVDGSERALKAVDLAAELAAKDGADLLLFAVVNAHSRQVAGLEAYERAEHLREPIASDLVTAAADDILGRARDRAAIKGARRIAVETDIGDPALQIVEAARSHEIDLIAVGSRGHGRFAGLLLGSVAQKVIAHAPCPVLVAR